jgi:hypothetical protein
MKSAVWKVLAGHDILSPRAITLSKKGTNVTSGASLHSGGELPKLPHQNGGPRCLEGPEEFRQQETKAQ